MSYKSLLESANETMLRTNFDVFPYEWDAFKELIDAQLGRNYKIIKQDDDEVLANIKTNKVIARYDAYDNIMYTDIAKRDFFLDVKANRFKQLKQYFR